MVERKPIRMTLRAMRLELLASTLALIIVDAVRAQSPAPSDAVIEEWSQKWNIAADGGTVYHERRVVRLHNDRAYGEFADPRITYWNGRDKLELITARTRRTDGTTIEPPDYSRNTVSPFESAGWPAYAALRQLVVTMSGVEPGCAVELEFRITSPPAASALPCSIRLDHRYPVLKHEIEVTNASPTAYAFGEANLDPLPPALRGGFRRRFDAQSLGAGADAASGGQPSVMKRAYGPFPAAIDEPQAMPVAMSSPHLVFAPAQPFDAWLAASLARIEGAADTSDLVRSLATKWTKDATSDLEKLRALQERLAATLSTVEFPLAWRADDLRPASAVLNENYGLPEEAGAALLSLARAAGLKARPALVARMEVFDEAVPQADSIASYAVAIDAPAGPVAFDARLGRIRRATHPGCTIYSRGGENAAAEPVQRTALSEWTSADDSACRISGSITVDDAAKLSGRVTVRASGLFADADALRSRETQQARLGELLGRVVPGLAVREFSIKTLSEGAFEADVDVAADKPLDVVAGCHALRLAQDGPWSSAVLLPVAHSRRLTPVRIAGPFEDSLDLKLAWPKGWTATALPIELKPVPTAAAAHQSIEPTEHGACWKRTIKCEAAVLAPDLFLGWREPLNRLRADSGRTLLLKRP